jgi:hypothetical protein
MNSGLRLSDHSGRQVAAALFDCVQGNPLAIFAGWDHSPRRRSRRPPFPINAVSAEPDALAVALPVTAAAVAGAFAATAPSVADAVARPAAS